ADGAGEDHRHRRAKPPHQHREVAPGLSPGAEVGVNEGGCGHVHAGVDTTLRPMARADSIVLVNTGDGKGKSSAAFGVMGRAWARGWRVAVVQFIKADDWHTGEKKLADHLGVDWHTLGDGFTWESSDLDETAAKARHAWVFA